MNEWLRVRKSTVTEIRPYVPGESLNGVSVSPDAVPVEGDFIARDPNNPTDQWHVTAAYVVANYIAA